VEFNALLVATALAFPNRRVRRSAAGFDNPRSSAQVTTKKQGFSKLLRKSCPSLWFANCIQQKVLLQNLFRSDSVLK